LKKLVVLLVGFMFLFQVVCLGANDFKLQVNGKDVVLEDEIVSVKGRTLLPFRAFFEVVGAEVRWDSENSTAIGIKGSRRVEFPVGSSKYIVNGKAIPLSVPAQIINNKTYVPIRAGGESLGLKVEYKNGVINLVDSNLTVEPGDDSQQKGGNEMWKHPAGYYLLLLDKEWEVKPVTLSQIGQGYNSNTVIQAKLSKGDYTVIVQHYPCKGLTTDYVSKALTAPLKSLGVNIDLREEKIGDKKIYYSIYQMKGTRLTGFGKWSDLGFGIDIWSQGGGKKEELKKLLDTLVSAIKCDKKLNSDPTNGNKNILGKWKTGSSDHTDGLYNDSSFDTLTTFAFKADGTIEYHQMSSFTFYGSDYGGSTSEERGGGYYRVLDDIMYIYGEDAVIYVPFAVGMGTLQLGTQRMIKSN